MTMFGKDINNQWQPIKLGNGTSAVQTIGFEQAGVSEGNSYYVGNFTTLDTNESIIFTVDVPATTSVHMNFAVQSSGIMEYYQMESVTRTGGTSAVPTNYNRNSNKSSALTVMQDPTITWAGNQIEAAKHGTEGFKENIGGSEESKRSQILLQGATTEWKFVSGADNNYISYKGFWHEY